MALRDYVLNNFWWKLLSLLLAALTWLTIGTAARNEQKQQENLRESPVVTGSSSRSFPSVPLTLLTSASNSAHFTVTPATVLIVVSGKPEDLTKLQLRDIRALVDVTDADD